MEKIKNANISGIGSDQTRMKSDSCMKGTESEQVKLTDRNRIGPKQDQAGHGPEPNRTRVECEPKANRTGSYREQVN